VRHNKLAGLVITKLDVLDSFEEIRVCRSYRAGGRLLGEFDPLRASELEPEYITMPGWRKSTERCEKWSDLPLAARRYVSKLEELCDCPVIIISTGKDRKQTINVKPNKLNWLRTLRS